MAEEPPLPLDFLTQHLYQSQIWVAVDEQDGPIGFAIAQDLDGKAYLLELDVHPAYGRQGIGRDLVETVCAWAQQQHYSTVVLSTFRSVAWNAPFYATLGFQVLDESQWTAGLYRIRQAEAKAGLAVGDRLFMYRDL